MGHDVFISYSSKDKNIADAVCAALERDGVKCWVAPRDILPGANWAASILKAIADSRLVVLVFSRHTHESQHVRREVERAVHHGVAIAPLRVDDVMPADDLEYYLSSSHWMDAMTPPLEQHLRLLVEKVRSLLDVEEPSATGQISGEEGAPSVRKVPAVSAAVGTPSPGRKQPARARTWSKGRLATAAAVLLGIALLGILVVRGDLPRLLSRGSPTPAPTQADPAPAEPPEPGGPRLGQRVREVREATESRRRARVAALLTTARENDAPGKARDALAALDELLALDPSNAEATALRSRISAYPRTFTNSVGMRFVEIKPGEFMMGSPEGEEGRDDDEVRHRVRITRPFMMGAYEVTQGQWKAVTGGGDGPSQDKDHPVQDVSWEAAAEFAGRLGRKEGKKYRLPTEAEWEYACRAGTTTPFHTGATISADDANYNGRVTYAGGRYGVYRGDTTPVGTFAPNAWGLHDMHGNAVEWCADWYADYPAGEAADPKGPGGPPAPDKAFRVLRGGSWEDDPAKCRAAARHRMEPANHSYDAGFRLCLDLE